MNIPILGRQNHSEFRVKQKVKEKKRKGKEKGRDESGNTLDSVTYS